MLKKVEVVNSECEIIDRETDKSRNLKKWMWV